MFKKVLVVQGIESAGIAVIEVLEDCKIPVIDHVRCCDEGLLNIKKALINKEPYDLLITDLFFKADYCKEVFICGDDLIKEVHKIQPKLKRIIFSMEDEPVQIKKLFSNLEINGYVFRSNNNILELKTTIVKTYNNEKKTPLSDFDLNDKPLIKSESDDISIIQLLKQGYIIEGILIFFVLQVIHVGTFFKNRFKKT